MTDTINYSNLMERAERDARELLESADDWDTALDLVHDFCEWDWVIYSGKALDLCAAVPNDVLDNAEDVVSDCGYIGAETTLCEHASAVAYWIIRNAIMEQVTELWEA
jgi:hypothetical protein